MSAAPRLAAVPHREPLEIDGSIDQRDQIAEVASRLHAELERLRADYNFAMGLLRTAMIGAGEKKRATATHEFRFVGAVEYWCAEHMQPPVYCRSKHGDDETVDVVPVVCEPELRATRL